MVTTQEIIERSFYIALLHETLTRGLTINPDDYLELVEGFDVPVPTTESESRFNEDKKAIGDKFIYIFGIGNNQVRGAKLVPRITLELKAYYPGTVGLDKSSLEMNDEGIFQAIDYDYETKSTLIDVHLVSNTEDEMRLLHDIMYRALPARGYLKPYVNDYEEWKSSGIQTTGNLYIEVGNYYDHQDLNHGLLEKVYTYECRDGLLMEKITEETYVPIKDISCLIIPEGTEGVILEVPHK